VQTYSRNQIKC